LRQPDTLVKKQLSDKVNIPDQRRNRTLGHVGVLIRFGSGFPEELFILLIINRIGIYAILSMKRRILPKLFLSPIPSTMKTVGIIGGSGFIGSHVTKKFLAKGHKGRVSATDISNADKYAHLKQLPHAENLEIVPLDVRNKEQISDFINGCQIIVHGGTGQSPLCPG
jgi:hypothetical protein